MKLHRVLLTSIILSLMILASVSLLARAATAKLELLPLPATKYSLARTNFPKRTIWLGLYCKGRSCELRKVILRASPTKVSSYDEGKVPGQLLKIEGVSLPICLLRGLPNSTPRKVTTYYRPAADKRAATTNQSIKIKAEGKTPYRIVLRKSKSSMSYSLEHGNRKQLLEDLQIDPVVGESGLTRKDEIVIWSGDIDEDGKADFLTGLSNRSGEALTVQLYLSRGAGNGKIVKPAVRFDYWPPDNPGC
jgi:hypothetical protein